MTLDATCPACGLAVRRVKGFNKCLCCSHRWLSGSAEASYGLHYAGYDPDPVFEQRMRWIMDTEFASICPPPAEVLDVGCGAGDFLLAAKERGYNVRGIDISEGSQEICRRRGLDGQAADFLGYGEPESLNLITMWDVVEHLPDPASFFSKAHLLLRPGGYLFTKIPGFGGLSVGLSKRVPRLAGVLLGAPDHVQYFNRRSLAILAERSGFTVEWIEPPFRALRQRRTGGKIKTRIARHAARTIHRLSDENLLMIARKV